MRTHSKENASIFNSAEYKANIPESDLQFKGKLKYIRKHHVNKFINGHININLLRSKFNSLIDQVNGNLDIVIGSSKAQVDQSFPNNQFLIPGYKI